MKGYPNPVYELGVDDRFAYLLTFPAVEDKSREDMASDFVKANFAGTPEHRLRMLRPNEYGKVSLNGYRYIHDRYQEDLADEVSLDCNVMLSVDIGN